MMTSDPRETHVAFTELVDLASERLGGIVLFANDEFFAPKENLLKPGRAVFIADEFTDRGKWMDGWETRRRRTPGHDFCVIQLGVPGAIRGVLVDTDHFIGNFPEACAVDAVELDERPRPEDLTADTLAWHEILPKSRLRGGAQNVFAIADERRFTHVRLRIFPDGGVARLRVHGEARPNIASLRSASSPIDLVAVENGGAVVIASDMFFGPKDNLIMPGRAKNMGDGWETRRRRGPGHDWIVVRAGFAARIQEIEVDTNHFKGNAPESCSIDACGLDGAPLQPADFLHDPDLGWVEILPRTKLSPHTQHLFRAELRGIERAFTHVRLNIFPDGGVSRLRVRGRID